MSNNTYLYIGLMSGTSMDGVDGVLASFTDAGIATVSAAHLPFPDALRNELMALQAAGDNEIHREALAANALARLYARCVAALLDGRYPADVLADVAAYDFESAVHDGDLAVISEPIDLLGVNYYTRFTVSGLPGDATQAASSPNSVKKSA